MLPEMTTNNSAPDDSECVMSLRDDDFIFIAQLTKEEKKELIEWFKKRKQN